MEADLHRLYNRDFYHTANGGSVDSARACAPLVMELLRPSSIVDIGCGQGEWVAAFAELGIDDYLGVDGDHVTDEQLVVPRDRFMRHDLTRPLRLARRFDVALSLEVGEHLPHRVAPVYIEDLVRLAPAVVFSAAVPGQGGVHHVNEQWPEYWKELFARHKYVQLDPFRQTIWKNPDVTVYYQHNLFLYVDPAVHQRLINMIGVPDKYTELTLIRTSILQELTQPSPAVRFLQRIGRQLDRFFRRGRRNDTSAV